MVAKAVAIILILVEEICTRNISPTNQQLLYYFQRMAVWELLKSQVWSRIISDDDVIEYETVGNGIQIMHQEIATEEIYTENQETSENNQQDD